ncbi:MAG: O-antigen ligase family protein [Clostridia bacterium]|nr:O-antigen ligase family protein [Clostridia bacterium]
MAKKKLVQASTFQLLYEKVLGISALLLSTFYIWLSFARHFFSPENRIGESSVLVIMLKSARYFAIVLLVASLAYLIITKIRFPDTWYRIRNAWKGLQCKEYILLLVLFVYYVLCCSVNSQYYTNIFRSNDLYLFDMAVSVFLLFPMANVLGYRRMRKYADIMLHVVMVISTSFIVWALWNLFHLNIVQLPNGLSSGMTSAYTFYPGVNQNIAAAIGTTMVMISLYMIVCHSWPIKVVYSFALIIHLTATLLTASRGNFVALLVCLPAVGGMVCWNSLKKRPFSLRCIITGIVVLIIAIAVWWLRSGVFTVFDSITHLSKYLNSSTSASASASGTTEPLIASGQRSLTLDAARARIWRSSIKVMLSSPRHFFFGVPLGRITAEIKSAMESIYGTGSQYAHAHNMILQTGLVTGVPGMLMFIAFLVMMMIRCIRVSLGKTKAVFPGAFVLPISILGMVIVNLFEPFLLFYVSVMGCMFFLYCGWTVAIDKAD